MAGKNLCQFDLNVNALESNDAQEVIGEISNDAQEVIGEISNDNTGNDYQDVSLFNNPQPKRKRHTQQQIEQLEAFFNECPNPDSKQRKALGLRIGLEPLQIKFWFQNKRTQMKTQHGHHENMHLREENRWLKAENLSYKEALKNATCHDCGGPLLARDMSMDEYQLRLENTQLKEEVNRISAVAKTCTDNVFAHCTNFPPATSS